MIARDIQTMICALLNLHWKKCEDVMEQNKSEIARLREQWALEEQAAGWARLGLAVLAPHDTINARIERGGRRILQLIDEGKHEEAQAMMNTEWWEEDQQDGQEENEQKEQK